MGRKDRELSISGLAANADLKALTAIFSRFGPCKDVFFIHGSTVRPASAAADEVS